MSANPDLVIVGGGLVGASLAVALRERCPDLDLLVLERFAPPSEQLSASPSFDGRATALSYGSRLIYDQLGLWPALADTVAPIREIHVSSQGQLGATRLDSSAAGTDALGYVVENRVLGQALWARMRALAIPHWAPSEVEELRPQNGRMALRVCSTGEEPQTLHAQLVVLADGGRSTLASSLGIGLTRHGYRQSALVTTVKARRAPTATAFERFTPRGPIALLPLSRGRTALVWTLPDDQLRAHLDCDDTEFLERLQRQVGPRLGEFERVGERSHYPLARVQANEQVRSSLVLLGNSAHSLHPVAGQSFNLALRDVVALTETLGLQWDARRPLGALDVLQTYAANRALDQTRIATLSHVLPQLFADQPLPMRWARAMGLGALEFLPTAQRGFARWTMGLSPFCSPPRHFDAATHGQGAQ